MEKILRLYTLVNGVETPFPSDEGQIEISAFRYDAKRMGGAPIIGATVMYPTCLDSVWTNGVYATFKGEKYFLKKTPTSSFESSDSRYKHDLELVSERTILDDVYFLDVVSDDVNQDKMVSNGSSFSFFGDIFEFARRLELCFNYTKVGYSVVVDEGVSSVGMQLSFDNAFLSNAIQECYNVFEIPYYFVGKVLHFGDANATIEDTFRYGVDDALVGITKENANFKIVNRATATGSSDNIPFYYPNKTPKGDLAVDTTSTTATFTIKDDEAFSNEVNFDDVVRYSSGTIGSTTTEVSSDGTKFSPYSGESLAIDSTNQKAQQKWFIYTFSVSSDASYKVTGSVRIDNNDTRSLTTFLTFAEIHNRHGKQNVTIKDGYIDCGRLDEGSHTLKLGFLFPYLGRSSYGVVASFNAETISSWYNETQEKNTSLEDMGLTFVGTLSDGDTITQRLVKYVKPSNVLLPSKYRETSGEERFYNATNNTYVDENDNVIEFEFPFEEGRPKEHIFSVEDIRPTIAGTSNSSGLRIDMFSAFAYDQDDNDETYEDGEGSTNYKHPYFFGKLRKLDFNLFDHAIEGQPMRFAFTSGDCGACEFEIGVDEESQKNTVQVDSDGDLIYDEEGRVLCGVEGSGQGDVDIQPQQNDTINNEVWIALRKEESTYGILMPNARGNLRPKACTSVDSNDGDTFVILGIKLPESYILNAEKRLESEVVKYLRNNNLEKFNFSITLSRIFIEENPSIISSLDENAKIYIEYNGEVFEQYVSSYSYTMSEGDILPEVRIELSESLTTSQNAMQNAINEVKATMGRTISSLQNQLGTISQAYVSKQGDDVALGVIDFTKGLKAGEGAILEILENNSAKLTIEYLDVTKKATFNSIEIQEKKHIGGQLLVTNASIVVGEVEELFDFYRCYFQTKGENDKQVIFNNFAIGDQAICQTFNAWGTRYYWRLVVGVGEDYIDLSKNDCHEDSMIPIVGDRVIQLGNRDDEKRQNAIIIAAYGEEAPYIIQYKGINSYVLPQTSDDERIMTKLSPSENVLTGIVKMTAGSKGLEMFEEWARKQALIDSKASNEDFEAFKEVVEGDIENIKKQVDGAITTWFFDPVPTLDNAPANEWTTKELKDLHLGDLYYSGEGKAYRFQYDNATSTYYWNLIEDEDISKALGDAKKAQDTADGKRRVFVVQPTPPYDKGDLWSRGSTLPMLVCVNAKASGSFVESDWNYADNNSLLSASIGNLDLFKTAIENNFTIIDGGLIQSTFLKLGYHDDDGVFHTMSGTNGLYSERGIAGWYGGDMVDKEENPSAIDYAKILFRFDGSGYFAGGNISLKVDGGATFGNGSIEILPSGAIVLKNSIKISEDGDETLESVLTSITNLGGRVSKVETSVGDKLDKSLFDTLFTPHYDKDGKLESIEARVSLWSNGEITALGQGTGGSGGGGGEGGADLLLDVWLSIAGDSDSFKDYQVNARHLTAYLTRAQIQETYATKKDLENIDIPTLTESDPIFKASAAYGITDADIANWNSIRSAIPTSLSDLANDVGYITSAALGGLASESWVTSNFLGLRGGTITSTSNITLTLNSTHSSSQNVIALQAGGNAVSYIGYYPTYGVYIQNYAVSGTPFINITSDGSLKRNNSDVFYHSGNSNLSTAPWACSNLTASGEISASSGTLTGGRGVYTPLVVKNTNLSEVWIQFQDSVGTCNIGSNKGVPSIYTGNGNKTIIHSGNYSSYAVKYVGDSSVDNARHSIGYDDGGRGSANLPEGFSGGFISADDGDYGFQMFGAGSTHKLFFRPLFNGSFRDWSEIIHSGNIGSQSVNSATYLTMKSGGVAANYRGNLDQTHALYTGGWASSDLGYASTYGTYIDLSGFSSWYHRLAFNTTGEIEHFMGINTTTLTKVGSLAYLSSNVASATKLATARTIWGQSFDGTGDVSGDLYLTAGASQAVIIYGSSNKMLLYSSDIACQFGASQTEAAINGSPLTFYINGSEKMRINSAGKVGIGTNSPEHALDVVGDIGATGTVVANNFYGRVDNADRVSPIEQLLVLQSEGSGMIARCPGIGFHLSGYAYSTIKMRSDGSFGFYNNQLTGYVDVQCNNITAGGEVTALGSSSSSDRRLKDIVTRPTPLSLEDIAKLNVISFKWNHRENDKRLKIGLIAQEVQEILPELVGVDRSNYLTLDYSTFGSVVGVMNTKKILSLEERVEALENEMERRKIYG